jgi:hypothetical protein
MHALSSEVSAGTMAGSRESSTSGTKEPATDLRHFTDMAAAMTSAVESGV